VGTGPFVFANWASSGEIRFEANRRYHGKEQGGVPGIEVTAVPDDNIRNELLRYGAVDLVPKVRPRDIPALEELGGVRLYPYSTLSYSFLGLNFRNPALRELRVREALAVGFDRSEMLKAHYGNRGVVLSGPFPPASWAYNFDVDPRPYDAEKAASLLDAAEVKDKNGDGMREYEGAPLTLRLVSLAQNEAQKAVVLDIQQQLKNLGIAVMVRFLEPLAWKKAVFEDHDFDLVLAEWTFDHSVNIYSLFHSTEAGAGQNNLGGYANPEVDRLLEESRTAPNSEALRAVYGELHRILHGDIPYVFLWSLHRYAAVSSRIENVRLHPFYFFTHVGAWKEK
jgi:peptide/nickel transport system substrate-binding protein